MAKKYQLPNGLTVILNESHKSPVVSVQMWVRTGSADEQKGEEGISHFIEHLVFKGTRKFGVGEIAATVEGSGGELNAYTSFDQTVFYVTISKQFTDVALEVVSEMMGFPTFDKDEIDNEREVVIEEIKRGQDSFGRVNSQLLFNTAYKGHPYSIPVIGYDKVVNKVSKKKIEEYFHSRYVPKNMFLVVSGDFENKEMKSKIKEYFGDFVDYKKRLVKRKKEAPQEKPRIKVEQVPFEESAFNISWKIPKVNHKDIPALDILALVLGQGESSRLVQKLRIEKPLVNSTYASTFTPLEKGIFVVSAVYNQENLSEILDIVQDEVEKISTDLISEEEMAKALTNIESEEFYGMETVDGLSRKAGHLEFLMKDPNYFPKYMKQVYAVTREDVLRVARKYLKSKNMIFTMSVSENGDLDVGKKSTKAWVKEFGKRSEARKPKIEKQRKLKRKKLSLKSNSAGKAETEVFEAGNGAKIIFRSSYDTPTLSVRMAHLGGVRIEEENAGGLTEVLARTWASGTPGLSEKEIQLKMENSASSINAFGGRNTAGLSLESLTPFEEDVADLFAQVLTSPVWPEEAIAREKHIMKEQLKNRDDNPAQKAMLKFMELIFKNHPYARDPKGSVETLDRIQRGALSEHWQKMSKQSNMVAVVSGYVNRDLWKERMSEALNKLSSGEAPRPTFTVDPLEENQSSFEKLDKEQTHIVTGVRGLTFKDEDRYALELIQSILAGQGGRLFMELRDKASLAYTVSPLKMEGIDTGYFGAYIGCSPEKGKQAIRMLWEEFNKLKDVKVGEEELLRSKRYLIGRHDIELQRNSATATGMLFNEVYGIPYDEVFNYAEKINEVSPDHIQRLATRLFEQEHVTVAVGSESPF